MAILPFSNVYQAVLGISVFWILYYVYWEFTVGASRRRIIKEHGCKPPLARSTSDPFLGIDLILENRRALKEHRILAHTRARFAALKVNTFQIKYLAQTIILTIEPENLKAIQSLQFKEFGLGSRRIIAFTPFLGKGIFTTDGAAWSHSREMLRPNFNRSQVGDLAMFETHVNHLISAIPRDGSIIDLQELFFRLTMDSATEFLFGESTNCLKPGTSTVSARQFAESFMRGQVSIGQKARWGSIANLFVDSRFKQDCNFVHDFVDSFVEKGLAYRASDAPEKADDRYVFCYELMKQTQDKVQIRSELLNILLAGRDTTASLLSDLWFELARRPDIWAKLRVEVDDLGGQKPTYTQIKDMKYLRFVLNECLRLHPVVPANFRVAFEDTTLPVGGGPDGKSPIFVPKGTAVAWSLYTMHRRKDYYGEDADEFKPERWETLRPGWEYLPFNGGPRICIGQQFALTEASYTTIRLMQEFKTLESRDNVRP
ncbi:hypothetical protein MMC11_002138 [Xylographa trunciseda]|nr:hypothetical protein [Xylographa trunciseda]